MIPILYAANETAFTSQGLGALADAVSVSIQRVLNGKDELTMIYPSDGIRYSDLANDRIVCAKPEYRKTAQPYQIYKITKPMNGMVTVYARHVGSQRTQYIPVTPFTAGSLTETLNSLPNHLAESSPFTFWTNKTVTANFKLSRPASLGKVLGGMEGSILDVYGGEYEFDGYTIKLWQRRGADSGVELRYAKNITDIEQSEDFASIITGVVPYWEGMDGNVVSLPEVVVQGQYADTYSFRRTIVKDFTDSFEDEPTVAELRAAATDYVSQSNLGVPEINLKVSFEHLAQYTGYENLQLLEKLNLGDTVSIFYEPLNVSATARIAKTTFDCLNEKYNSVQIGSVRSDLEQVMHTVSSTAAQIKQSLQQNIPSALAEAVENATDLITGANGGYVVLDRDANGKPFQILIMDTDDKATATNVLRLNQNGIGFSTSGYSGPFSTAWTIDSNFVADFITTGTLNAALAKIGILADAAGKNSWNMVTGAFSITDGSLNITTSSAIYDIIRLNWNNGVNNVTTQIWAGGVTSRDNNSKIDAEHSRWGFAVMKYTIDGSQSFPTASLSNGVLQLGGNSSSFPNEGSGVSGSLFVENSMGQTVATIQPSGNYEIFDTNGVTRSRLAGGFLYLYDSNGTQRQKLDSDGKLWQYDNNGKKRTYLEYGDIFMYTSAEKKTVQLSASAYTTGGSLRLYDTSEVERVRENIDGISLLNSSGTEQTKLGISGDTNWYKGRIDASIINKRQPAATDRYHPALDTKAYSSDWAIGTLNDDLYFVNTPDSNYSGGSKNTLKYKLPYISSTNGNKNGDILTTLNTTDRVIEQGTTSSWNYRKWASGMYECWRRYEHSVAVNTSWGRIYYGTIPRVNYPVTFASSPYEQAACVGGNAAAWIGGAAYSPTTTQTANYYLMRAASQSSTSYNIDYYVRGQLA